MHAWILSGLLIVAVHSVGCSDEQDGSTVPILSRSEAGLHPVTVPSIGEQRVRPAPTVRSNRSVVAGIDWPDAAPRVFVLLGLVGFVWALRRM